jgi:integrase/recombinase XerD
MTTTTDFAKHLSRFLADYLRYERNVSPNTIASYRDAFVQYIDFMKNIKNMPLDKLTLSKLTRDSVTGFLKWLMEVRKCSPATRNYRLAAIHSFASYLQYTVIERMEEWQKILSVKAMKSEKKALNYLSTDGIKLLLAQPDTSTRQGRRHLAMLSLMYDTGARVQELADLTVDSVRISYEPYTIRLFGQGRKARIVPLVKEQVAILREYMQENHLCDSNKIQESLFCNHRHEKLTREGISYVLKTYAKMARQESPELIPERLSCHSLRHSRAMHLLQAGVNLVYIRDILGHVSIQTTDVYARADSKAKREALEKAYTELTPNKDANREWERSKDLHDWLKRLQI